MPADKKRLIILVHGIRDAGFWQDDLKAHFERHPRTTVVTAKADIVDLFRFLSPLTSLRNRPVERIKAVIENAIAANRGAEVTIIAHSFGTWMVSKILHDDTNIVIDRLILCGAIVPGDFRWDRVQKINLRGRKNAILNEYSPLDFWPLAAKVLSYGYGNCGSRGIGDSGVCDRRHSIPHSGYLNTGFARTFWDPFIFQGKIVPGDTQPARTPKYFLLTRVPLNYMTMALVLAFISLSAIGFYWLSHVGNLEIGILSYRAADIRMPDGRVEPRFPQFRFSNDRFNLEVFQYVDQGDGDKLKALTLAPADNIEIEVTTRPPIRCGEDEPAIPWTDHRTTYGISYVPQSWWRNILARNWKGTVELTLEYEPRDQEGGRHDRLIVHSAKGIAPGSRILVASRHDPDGCLDAELQHRMHGVPERFASAGRPGRLWHWLTGISIAQAAEKSVASVKRLLGSRDRFAREVAIRNIQQNPELLDQGLSGVLDPGANASQIGDVLTGLVKSGDAAVIFSPDILEPVFELTWNEDAAKRAAARRFLSTDMVARTNVTPRFKAVIDKNWDELVGQYVRPERDPTAEKRYLALIALRDVYYNGALFRLEDIIDLAVGGTIDSELEAVLAILADGEPIKALADPATSHAFAKLTYGKALSLFRYARVKLALERGTAAKELSHDAIRTDLIRFEKENIPVPLDRFRAAEAREAFAQFLEEVKGREEHYVWPHHIAQARACIVLADALPADCLNAAE